MHFVLALLLGAQTASPAANADSAHVVLVATTDVHGRVLAWDYVCDRETPGGLSRAAAMLETLRAQYPEQVVVVDAGDLLQGNPFAGYFGRVERRRPNPMVDALNALHYDAAVPGNHDFDFGLDLLREAALDATYRYVSANVVTGPRDSLLFPATLVVQRGRVRVGIIGLTTPGVMVWDRRQLGGTVRVRPVAAAAPGALAALDRAAVDLKVVVIHGGLGGPSSYDTAGVGPENDAAALAGLAPKPDIVVVGHTHREMRDSVINGVHFVQPKNWAQSLSVVHIWFARDTAPGRRWRVTSVRADIIPLATVDEVPGFVRRFADAHQRARAWADEALGTGGPGLDARYGRAADTPLIDFVNEVQRRRAGTQLSATAAFDVSAGLPDGTIRRRDVAGVYPYENTLVALRISGGQLRAYLEHATRYYRALTPGRRIVNDAVPGYDFDMVSGATYRIDLTQPLGRRIVGLAVGGTPVAPTDSFSLATNSYRAAGGGGYDMLRGARVVYDRGEDVAGLLAEEVRRTGAVQAAAYFTPSWSILPPADSAARAAFAPPPLPARLETPWADVVIPDRDRANPLAREQREVDSLIGRTVATLEVGMRREGDEYPLGRLFADAFRHIGRADVGLVTNDGIRANLAAGSLSYGALLDALPFQHRLVRIALPGAALREALERALEPGRPTAHVSGLRVTYDPRRPAGQRISRIRLLNGRPLDPRRTYTLAVQDVVAAGGDGFRMLTAWPSTDAGLTDLGAVVGYLSVLGQPVRAPADERFQREIR